MKRRNLSFLMSISVAFKFFALCYVVSSGSKQSGYPVESFEEEQAQSCNPSTSDLNFCAYNGGWWEYASYSCQY